MDTPIELGLVLGTAVNWLLLPETGLSWLEMSGTMLPIIKNCKRIPRKFVDSAGLSSTTDS